MQINRSFNGYGEIDATENSSGFSYNLTRNNSGRITAKLEQVEGMSNQFAYSYDNIGRLLTPSAKMVHLSKSTATTTTATAPTR
jgi:hypothetical protein